MKHFLYVMDPCAKAPAGSTNYEDWFEGYKWMVEGECYIPVSDDSLAVELVEPGDLLWFFFLGGVDTDAMLKGSVEILRTQPDPLNSRVELWYDGASCREASAIIFTAPPGFYALESYNHLAPLLEEVTKETRK